MNCNQARKLIDVYVDNELDMRQRTAFDAHLASCSACADQVAKVQRLRALSQSFDTAPPEGLREKVALEIRHQSPNAMDRIKEKLVMKNRLRMGVGLATAVAVVALGVAFVLAPKPAVASSAIKVFERMKTAAKSVGALHQVIEGKLPDGTPWKVEIWTDGEDLWVDRMGHLEVIYKGKFHYGGKPLPVDPDEGTMVAVGQVDPQMFTLTNLLMSLGRDESQPMDLGFTTFKGKQVQMVGILQSGSSNRHTFYVPIGSDLPLRSIVETKVNGVWVQSEYVDYEFIDKLDPALFKNLPPAVETRDTTPEDILELAKVAGSKKIK